MHKQEAPSTKVASVCNMKFGFGFRIFEQFFSSLDLTKLGI